MPAITPEQLDLTARAKAFYRAIPMDDKESLKRAGSGKTTGLFQLGGATNRRGLEELRPKKTLDVVAAQALFRPAPMQSGFTRTYLRRRAKAEPIPTMHPDIMAELKDTYGVALYQEQVVGLMRKAGLQPVQLTKLLKAVKSSGRTGEIAAKATVAENLPSVKALAYAQGWEDSDVDYLAQCLVDYGAGYCVTGDTVVTKSAGGRHGARTLTVRELCEVWNGPNTPARKKYRAASKGLYLMARDAVDGRIRPDRVLEVLHQGVRPVWTVTLASGHTLTATANHKHATDQGWRRVDELQAGDLLAVMGERQEQHTSQATGQPVGRHYGLKATREDVLSTGRCSRCGASEATLEVAHLDHDRRNNERENLTALCRPCHRQNDWDTGALRPRHSRGRPVLYSPVVEIVYAGEQDVYDLSMEGEDHSWVANGIVTSNSFGKAHSVTYGVVGYLTAYLATHEPLAFWTGMLNAYMGSKNSKGVPLEPIFARAAREDGVRIMDPHVNRSGVGYIPDPDKFAILKGLVSVKGIGKSAANKIVAGAPYASWVDFGQRSRVSGSDGLIEGLAPEDCSGVVLALHGVRAFGGIPQGTPIVKRSRGGNRRCYLCKTTFEFHDQWLEHVTATHPEGEP